MTEEMITITKIEYDKLFRDSMFLKTLKELGVDNWGGYSDALVFEEEMSNYKDYYDEEEL